MNLAIQITCLLIEAAEEGVDLKLKDDHLLVRVPDTVTDELLDRLKENKPYIIQRLNHDISDPNPFINFFDLCLLFCPQDTVGTGAIDIFSSYDRWSQKNGITPLSKPKLVKFLRHSGGVDTNLHDQPWWQHVMVWDEGLPV